MNYSVLVNMVKHLRHIRAVIEENRCRKDVGKNNCKCTGELVGCLNLTIYIVKSRLRYLKSWHCYSN